MCKNLFLGSMILLLMMTVSTMAQIDPSSVSDGHVYLFEDVGTDVPDDSGNANTANLVGSPQVVDGLKGKALQFDGVDDGVHIPDGPMINLSTHQNHTVVVVFQCSDVTKPEKQVVYDEGGTTRGVSIYVHEGLVYAGGWNLSDYTPEWTGTFISYPIASDEWISVAAVLRDAGPAQEDDKFEMWVNGQFIDIGPGGQLQSRSNDCAIGYANAQTKFHDGNLTGGGGYFEGVVDELWIFNQALTEVELSQWSGKPWPFAFSPNPSDGSMISDVWTNITWSPGALAVSHDVYIGDNFEDVEIGAEGTFLGNQAATELVVGFPGFPIPDGLVPGVTYYWRVDEVNEAEPNSPWKGDIWSFSVPPKTAYFPDPADGAEGVSVDVQLSWTPGFGSVLHYVYFGDNYDDVSNATGALPLGGTTYQPGTLKMAKTYYWRIDEFDVVETHKGDVWSFTTEGAVTAVNPVNGAVDVSQTPVLTWAPGLGATYDIYFGADSSALEKKASGNLGEESYESGQLEWNTTYYWRVDEANNANADSPWTGPLWSFTTANFLIIDDMEAYNDLDPDDPLSNRIFNAWIDGYDDPTNGSLVGNDIPPFAEQTIVNSGNQSMPMFYDNSTAAKSEATLTLTTNRDWTVKGVDTLTIWFRGASANAAEQMYVTLNGTARVDCDIPDAATLTRWTEWNIPLQAFADHGVNLSNVNSITLGLASVTGGTGTMYFDDIRLYPPAP